MTIKPIWTLIFDKLAYKHLNKLDKPIQKQIIHYFESKVLLSENPRQFAEPLIGDLIGYYRFRIGTYRVICIFEDHELVITAVEVAHRKQCYVDMKRR
ncbi:MAG: type II toxin-antitoxin system RelE/ParE family toxin [Alphaproteobacteria bacterium]|nr:type II toxin-antitoxin system RelE/ParE family toxin [Alphaproteobacteria bacterium]